MFLKLIEEGGLIQENLCSSMRGKLQADQLCVTGSHTQFHRVILSMLSPAAQLTTSMVQSDFCSDTHTHQL